MKTKLYYLLLILFSVKSFSQEIPVIKVGDNTLKIKKLDVKVSVVGDIAITTYDMQFYNPKNRELEGELSFPLDENQSVTRFALDINGSLREAVVVEKEKARVAFETTVRNKIDPALLEKTKGNNYKARVYPIPAKGYKRVVLAFQQKLIVNNQSYYYKLPLNFKNKLENFSLSIEVLNQKNKPISKNSMIKEFFYNAENESYYAKINKRKTKVTQPVLVQIPLNTNKERLLVNEDYFYFKKQLDIKTREIPLEKNITIFWDTSLSQKNKKIATEIAFLDAYFKEVKNCEVTLVVFNIEVKKEKQFSIKNSNWNLLKTTLENTIYDGASAFDFLSKYKNNSELNLLFTDGLNTLSNKNVELNTKTHIINSTTSANHLVLKNSAILSGGKYINLQQLSIKNAIKKVSESQLQFLGTNFLEQDLEVYPKRRAIVEANFFISGKGNFFKKKVELYFGYGKDTVRKISFVTNKKKSNSIVSKIWAQNKLNYLVLESEKNKNEIIYLSKQYQIISPFTSMLILDRVEDYVTHNIEPPKELKEQYDELISQKVNNKKERIQGLKNSLFSEYENFFKWYDKEYVVLENKLVRTPIVNNQIEDIVIQDTVTRNEEFFITGNLSDVNGSLPGVSIRIKGKNQGTETDFDGNYSLKVRNDDVLVFNYLGYTPIEKTVGVHRNLNLRMEEDGAVLDEIVIIGYGTERKRAVTSSISSIKSEEISNALTGKVSGVAISGSNTISESKPLYVVDGEVVETQPDVNAKDIQSMYVLNSSQSQSIYGSRANNGIVVITTKKGFENNLDGINDFEDLVKEKIELKGWNPYTPYLKALNKIENTKEAYAKYIELRNEFGTSPSFYIDVADFFRARKEQSIAIQILSNVAEIDLDNYELLKALAYKFEEYKLYKYAVYIYNEIIKLRSEDIQSYRDLALAYEYVGEYQKSIDLLYKIVNGELLEKDENRRFSGIEVIALNELNRMLHLYKDKIVNSHIDRKLIKDTSTDFRVLIDWNHNDTDIDLWVTDPNKERCFYSHKKTKIGGLMSDDMTDGFGPEQFILKKAIKGNYKINVKYYSNGQQKISGPTFLKITTFKNYGSKNEIRTTKLVRLTKVDEVIDIGEINF